MRCGAEVGPARDIAFADMLGELDQPVEAGPEPPGHGVRVVESPMLEEVPADPVAGHQRARSCARRSGSVRLDGREGAGRFVSVQGRGPGGRVGPDPLVEEPGEVEGDGVDGRHAEVDQPGQSVVDEQQVIGPDVADARLQRGGPLRCGAGRAGEPRSDPAGQGQPVVGEPAERVAGRAGGRARSISSGRRPAGRRPRGRGWRGPGSGRSRGAAPISRGAAPVRRTRRVGTSAAAVGDRPPRASTGRPPRADRRRPGSVRPSSAEKGTGRKPRSAASASQPWSRSSSGRSGRPGARPAPTSRRPGPGTARSGPAPPAGVAQRLRVRSRLQRGRIPCQDAG